MLLIIPFFLLYIPQNELYTSVHMRVNFMPISLKPSHSFHSIFQPAHPWVEDTHDLVGLLVLVSQQGSRVESDSEWIRSWCSPPEAAAGREPWLGLYSRLLDVKGWNALQAGSFQSTEGSSERREEGRKKRSACKNGSSRNVWPVLFDL